MTATTLATLEQQQQTLVAALFATRATLADPTPLDATLARPWAMGLAAYRANAHATAARALAAAYPVLRALLGPDSFDSLSRAYWHHAPPQRGDLAHWGATLPAFLEADAQLADTPYLADVARVEWGLHRAASAADGEAAPASFALLAQHAPERLRLRLAPGTALYTSRWPVASMILAHQTDPPDLREAAARLHAGVGETVRIWREGLRPRLRAIQSSDAQRLSAALAGASLQTVIEAAEGGAEAALAWIGEGIREGWVLGLEPDPGDEPTPHPLA
jgi:hypothetical protein